MFSVRSHWTDDFTEAINPEALRRLSQVCTGQGSYRCAKKGTSFPDPHPPACSPAVTEGNITEGEVAMSLRVRQRHRGRCGWRHGGRGGGGIPSSLAAWSVTLLCVTPDAGCTATHTSPLSWLLLLFPLAPKDLSPSFSFDLEFLELFYTILRELYSPPGMGCHL